MTAEGKSKIWYAIILVIGTILTTLMTIASTGINKGLDKKVDKVEYDQKCSVIDARLDKEEQISSEQMKLMIELLKQQERTNTNVEWLVENYKKNK